LRGLGRGKLSNPLIERKGTIIYKGGEEQKADKGIRWDV